MPKVYQFPEPKGLNTVTDQVNMKPQFFPVFRNAVVNEDGLWVQRAGYVKASAQIGGGPKIESLIHYRKRDGTQLTIAAAGGYMLFAIFGGVMLLAAPVMLVLAVYYAAALWLAGLDRALAIGLLTGLLVFIPYVGFGLGLILGVIAALLQWSGWPGWSA